MSDVLDVFDEKIGLPQVLGDRRSREEVMEELENDSVAYSIYLDLNRKFQELFIQFCMGVRGVKMTYDPFFKYIFDPEVHPERLSELLALIIGRPLSVKRVLPSEHRRITEKGSLLLMDILVEFQTGELANVEIQKVGYLFPGQRAACYASDMVMRQYEREKSVRGREFVYKDLKKVYTIVFMETSSQEFKRLPQQYLHRGISTFDTGLQLELLQEFYFIPLDVFFGLRDNKSKETIENELEAWLYFIGSDRPEDIQKVIAASPQFVKLYQEICDFRYHPEEAVRMFSEALRILDENTVKYMIEEQKKEIEEKDKEIEERDKEIDEQKVENDELKGENDELKGENDELKGEIDEKDAEIEQLKRLLSEKGGQ